MDNDVTLVINLSAGDELYAYTVVEALSAAHRHTVAEVVVVVDTLKSQFSRFYDHARRYAEPGYSRKIHSITATAERLKKDGIINRFIILSEWDAQAEGITKKFFRGHVRETHDFRGAPITAYLVGLNACNTTYAVHYDGDILLHQPGAADWVSQGIHEIKSNAGLIAASP
ncbi:MAG: hypothetical protein JST32_20990, partial [Bacteroidetes bacterium]|nr:hypothetical protein [Bacteroidota bacterium]